MGRGSWKPGKGVLSDHQLVLEALRRKRDGADIASLSEGERTLLTAVEFWAAAAHGTLLQHLRPQVGQNLAVAQSAFAELGAVRVVSLLRVAGEELRTHSQSSEASIIDQLDERLARTNDNMENLIARYAGMIDRSTESAAVNWPPSADRRSSGRRRRCRGSHVDQRAVLALALPLMANSAVQIVLNLTDMWFMGRISTKALAAVVRCSGSPSSSSWCSAAPARRCRPLVAQHYGGPPLHARRPGGVDRAVGDGLRGAAVPAGGAAPHLIAGRPSALMPGSSGWPRPSGSRASAAPAWRRRSGRCSGSSTASAGRA